VASLPSDTPAWQPRAHRRGAACGVAAGRHPRGPRGLVGEQEWRGEHGGAGRPTAGDLWRRHDRPSGVVRPDDPCERQTGRARPLHAPTGLSHGYDRAMGLHGRDVRCRPPSWRWSRLGKPCPSGMQRDTPGLTGAVARCGAGTVRGTSTVALRGCRWLRLHRCPSSAVLCSGHGTSRAARRQEEHACGCTTSEQPRPWHPTRAACARQTVGLPRGLADVTHRVLRVSCAARTGANVAA